MEQRGDRAERVTTRREEDAFEAMTPQLEMFRAAAARFREAGQLDGVTPFGWFLAGMGADEAWWRALEAAEIVAAFEPSATHKRIEEQERRRV